MIRLNFSRRLSRRPIIFYIARALSLSWHVMAGRAQQEYLQERALQLKAAAEQEAFRPKKSLIQTHKEDVRSLTLHACLLILVVLGAPPHFASPYR